MTQIISPYKAALTSTWDITSSSSCTPGTSPGVPRREGSLNQAKPQLISGFNQTLLASPAKNMPWSTSGSGPPWHILRQEAKRQRWLRPRKIKHELPSKGWEEHPHLRSGCPPSGHRDGNAVPCAPIQPMSAGLQSQGDPAPQPPFLVSAISLLYLRFLQNAEVLSSK